MKTQCANLVCIYTQMDHLERSSSLLAVMGKAHSPASRGQRTQRSASAPTGLSLKQRPEQNTTCEILDRLSSEGRWPGQASGGCASQTWPG